MNNGKGLVDVRALVRKVYKGWVPGFLLSGLEKLVHQDELNELMLLQDYVDGVDLSNRLLERLDISVDIVGCDRLPKEGERVLFASNHPLGGADGIVLTAVLGSLAGKNFHVMVNELLMQVWQMADVFVPLNEYGAQSRKGHHNLTEALEGEAQMLTFPAGAVSRKAEGGLIRDREWRPSFAKLAKRYERDIIPLYFEGSNSKGFYRIEDFRAKIGIKLNVGTILLPGEFLGAKGKHFTIYVGERIPFDTVPDGPDVKAFSSRVRSLVYTLPEAYASEERTPFLPVLPKD